MVKVEDKVALFEWNVYVGNRVDVTVRSLNILLNSVQPDVGVIIEASKLYGHLDDLGYTVVQLKPRSIRPGNVSNFGDIAIIVRKDHKIKKRLTQRMQEFWKGPVRGLPQDPRTYRWVKVDIDGVVWKIGGAHIPFGAEARLESKNKLVKRMSRQKMPTALLIDTNMSPREFQMSIAEPAGFMISGEGVDMIAYKNATLLSARSLGKNGSDHQAMLFELTPKK